MYVLSDQEIDDLCQKIISEAYNQGSLFTKHYELMYKFGLRVSEVCGVDNISVTGTGDVLIYMKKTRKYRLIKKEDFQVNFDIEIFLASNNLTYYSEQNIKREITNLSPYRRLFCGNKNIVTHIFRHNFAKQKFIQLQNIASVNYLLQESNLSICENYINSKIYYLDNSL